MENKQDKILEDSQTEDNNSGDSLIDDAKVKESQAKDVSSEENKVNDSEDIEIDDKKTDSASEDQVNEPKFKFKNLIGKKIGMTQLFSSEGNVYPATVIEAGPCSITQIKNQKNDGYDSIQIGFSDLKDSKVNKSLSGHFKKNKSKPKKVLKEFKVSISDNLPKVGDVVDLNQFNVGDMITVRGKSIGKGFAGHMKRHGFGGGRASHGKNSVMRKAGSVGAGTDPGRIFPGMKMAGRMGNNNVTTKNLQVLSIDYDNNLIFVKGCVPGPKNNYLFLTKN